MGGELYAYHPTVDSPRNGPFIAYLDDLLRGADPHARKRFVVMGVTEGVPAQGLLPCDPLLYFLDGGEAVIVNRGRFFLYRPGECSYGVRPLLLRDAQERIRNLSEAAPRGYCHQGIPDIQRSLQRMGYRMALPRRNAASP